MENLKYYIAAFLSGITSKLYDDLFDNNKLKNFRSEYILELLKGIHYILLTIISLKQPIFFIIFAFANMLAFISDKTAPYEKPYEKSMVISFFLLFFFIDYSKITFENLLTNFKQSITFFLVFAIEPFFITEDISFRKMLIRICAMCLSIYAILINNNSPELNEIIHYKLLYAIGYCLISSMIQYYSLYIHKEEPIKEEPKEEPIKEEPKEEPIKKTKKTKKI